MLKLKEASLTILSCCLSLAAFAQNVIWWEAELTKEHNFPQSNAFEARTDEEKAKLSNGDWLQTDKSGGAFAKWEVEVNRGGSYNLWARKFWKHGPFRWRFNDGEWTKLGKDCGLADSVDLRLHLCANWVYLGEVKLNAGKHLFEVRMDEDATAAAFDCFLLIDGPFLPRGKMKPGEKYTRAPERWFAFEPDMDSFSDDSYINLRYLNDKFAGEKGFLKAIDDKLYFEKSSEPVKFWAVNAGPGILELDRVSIRYLAKFLAKRGVNMVRIHSPIYDESSKDPAVVNKSLLDKMHYFVYAMKEEGIYIKLSFYFPLWFEIKPHYGIPGYNDKIKTPFSLLFFNQKMQDIYKSWAKSLMSTKNPYTGLSFADDPAIAIVEIINEDNYFFWTFKPYDSIPAECMPELEKKFAAWAAKKYGSLDKAFKAWGNKEVKGDNLNEKRAGLYNAGTLTGFDWAVAQRNQQRAFDTAQFLTEDLRAFFKGMSEYFRKQLGVKCAISAGNWTTADQRVLGPLDKYVNSVCDIIDRHGYYETPMKKQRSWTITEGDRYIDKSALLNPHGVPVQEIRLSNKPHIISETNWVFPNRFRAEGVMLLSSYGSLQGTDGIFLFCLSSANWQLQQNIWSVNTPVTMGQFPAAAMIFRNSYIREPEPVIIDNHSLEDLFQLKGTAVFGTALVDSFRKSDLPPGAKQETEELTAYDQLSTYVGPVELKISRGKREKSSTINFETLLDKGKKQIHSITKELFLDYDKGLLTINATKAQGAVGFLSKAGKIELAEIVIESNLEYASIIAVPLDDKPLSNSEKILIQAVSEETNYGWKTEPQKEKLNDKEIEMDKIISMGDFPIIVKKLEGRITLKRADAENIKVFCLDPNGMKTKELKLNNSSFVLEPDIIYYILEK